MRGARLGGGRARGAVARVALSVVVAAVALAGEAHAELVISEVMYDPLGADADAEWIELYNVGPDAVSLGAYGVGDEENPASNVEMMLALPNAVIAPGEAFVVARDAAAVAVAPGTRVFALNNAAPGDAITDAFFAWGSLSWGGLANTGDEVLLVKADGEGGWSLLDGVAWGAGATSLGVGGGPFIDAALPLGPEGRSLDRIDARVDTDGASDWLVQVAPSPGRAGPDPCTLPLRISEVHVDGATDPASEWIEVYNASALTIDLTRWGLGDQATQGASGEGLLRFPPGASVGPGDVVLVAHSASQLALDFGVTADFEYGADTDPSVPQMVAAPDWTSGVDVALDDSADEVVLICGLALRDALRWGLPTATVAPSPSPAYDGTDPAARQTFERLDLAVQTGAASDWAVQRCPSPGAARGATAPPDAGPAVVWAVGGSSVSLWLPGDDPDADALAFDLDATGALGGVTLLDAVLGGAAYDAPVGFSGPDTFRFTVSDGCFTTLPATVEVVAPPAACDPGATDLLLNELGFGDDALGRGAWIELYNPTDAPVMLSNLRIGDEETPGGEAGGDGMFIFPEGAWIEADDVVLIAVSALAFEQERGFAPDLELNRDTNGLDDDLARFAPWSGGTVRLAPEGDELYLVGCGGQVIDSVYWGEAPVGPGYAPVELPWDPRFALSTSEPLDGASLERDAFVADRDLADDWMLQRCPSPGQAVNPDLRPSASSARYPVALGASVSDALVAHDPEDGALTYLLTDPAPEGFELLSSADGAFAYTPPDGFTGLVEVAFVADDGCSRSRPASVTFCVGTSEVPGTGEDEDCDGVSLCFVDADGDGFGSSATIPEQDADGAGGDEACTGPGEAAVAGDCDDDPLACGAACSPVEAEICDGFDNDCDAATLDGADDPQLGAACDAPGDADLCHDDAVACVDGALACVDDPEGDALRVEVCDPEQLDEDCDGGADDDDPDGPPANALTYYADRDGDGFGDPDDAVVACLAPEGYVADGGDCDDDPLACGAACRPDREESLAAGGCDDGWDNDCDEVADLDPACFEDVVCYRDADGDGFGAAASAITLSGPVAGAGCAAYDDGEHGPGAWVGQAGDCDDDVAACGGSCHPDALEVCDDFDNDCDPATLDGHDALLALGPCDSPADANACEDDAWACLAGGQLVCVDAPAGDDVRVEVCDPDRLDEDCDGGADDADPDGPPPGAVQRWRDADGDGFGDPAVSALFCHPPAGWVDDVGDCDDDPLACGAACSPVVTESLGEGNCADGWNNDCDLDGADLDDACFEAAACWLDADGDGYGDAAVVILLEGAAAAGGCAGHDDGVHPVGSWVANGDDCDDDPALCGADCGPDAPEVCDGRDNDCDPATVDGAGDPDRGGACDSAADADLCLDDAYACVGGALVCINDPTDDLDQIEVCDAGGVDEDCDGGANDADPDGPPAGAPVWYPDRDGDTYGAAVGGLAACTRPPGYVANNADCDDDPDGCGEDCYPGNVELCDGRDNDCAPATPDGAGDPAVGVPCDSPEDDNACLDEVTVCSAGVLTCPNDAAGDEGRVEVCDGQGVDEDCDGGADDDDPEGPPDGAPTWYRDADGDGFGDPERAIDACDPPLGYVDNADDCDDDPLACGAACAPGEVESWAAGNCDDGFDNGCTGEAPDSGPGCDAEATCWPDFDGDGFGDPATPNAISGAEAVAGCDVWDDGVHAVGFWVSRAGDCDDADAEVYPGAPEVIGDGVDQSCSGADLCWVDRDNDGFASDGAATSEAPPRADCADAFGLAAVAGDCDDDPRSCGAACRPGGGEVCDGWDNDCDDEVDEGGLCGGGVAEPGPPIVFGGSGCASAPSGPRGLPVLFLAVLGFGLAVVRSRRRRQADAVTTRCSLSSSNGRARP